MSLELIFVWTMSMSGWPARKSASKSATSASWVVDTMLSCSRPPVLADACPLGVPTCACSDMAGHASRTPTHKAKAFVAPIVTFPIHEPLQKLQFVQDCSLVYGGAQSSLKLSFRYRAWQGESSRKPAGLGLLGRAKGQS